MRVLLTGGSGFLGRYVCAELESLGIEYCNLQRRTSTSTKMKTLDILNDNKLFQLVDEIRATHLIHLAWYTEHGAFWESTQNDSWRLATMKLVERFYRAGGKHVLITGTCAEYDWQYGYCREYLTPLNPKSLYSISKNSTRIAIESMCNDFGTTLTWCRIFYSYGHGEKSQRLIPSIFDVFSGKIPPFGVNAGSYLDFLNVRDVAQAIRICTLTGFNGDVNISSGQPVQVCDLVKKIARINNQDPKKILGIDPASEVTHKFLVGSNERLKQMGWQQKILLDDGLRIYHAERIKNGKV